MANESTEFAKRASGKLPDKVIETIATHVLPHVVRADQLSHRYQALRGVALGLWPTLASIRRHAHGVSDSVPAVSVLVGLD